MVQTGSDDRKDFSSIPFVICFSFLFLRQEQTRIGGGTSVLIFCHFCPFSHFRKPIHIPPGVCKLHVKNFESTNNTLEGLLTRFECYKRITWRVNYAVVIMCAKCETTLLRRKRRACKYFKQESTSPSS